MENSAKKLCKHCKSEIPYEAKICPCCRKKQSPSGCLIALLVILLLSMLSSALGGGSRRTTPREQSLPQSSAVISRPQQAPAETPAPTPVPEESPDPDSDPDHEELSGIRPEFKEAMDSYAEFFEEYAAFMEKFEKDPNDIDLLLSYTGYLTRYTEAMDKLDAVDEGSLTKEELAYYLDTLSAIQKRLLEVSSFMLS